MVSKLSDHLLQAIAYTTKYILLHGPLEYIIPKALALRTKPDHCLGKTRTGIMATSKAPP